MYPWRGRAILPHLASNSYRVGDSEVPWKGHKGEGRCLFSPFIWIPGLGGSLTGMTKKALREELGAGPVCLPIKWEDFGLKLPPPGWGQWTGKL